MSEWNVYYENGFYSQEDMQNAAPGKEIPANKEFIWKNEKWKILSIYLFEEGFGFHLCKQIDPEAIQRFQSKWRPVRREIQAHKIENLSDEQIDTMMADSPFRMDAFLQVEINGQPLEFEGTTCEGWNPVQDFDDDADNSDILKFLNHYSLDEETGWYFVHARARWPKEPIQTLEEIAIHFESTPVTMAGPHFTVKEEGEKIQFTRPLTGQQHTLRVLSYCPVILDYSAFEDSPETQWECPKHYFQLAYNVTPKLSDEIFFIADCRRGDSPRPKDDTSDLTHEVLHIGSVMLLSECDQNTEIPTFSIGSSLYFDWPENVQWRIIFREKSEEDFTLTLQVGRDFGIMNADDPTAES